MRLHQRAVGARRRRLLSGEIGRNSQRRDCSRFALKNESEFTMFGRKGKNIIGRRNSIRKEEGWEAYGGGQGRWWKRLDM